MVKSVKRGAARSSIRRRCAMARQKETSNSKHRRGVSCRGRSSAPESSGSIQRGGSRWAGSKQIKAVNHSVRVGRGQSKLVAPGPTGNQGQSKWIKPLGVRAGNVRNTASGLSHAEERSHQVCRSARCYAGGDSAARSPYLPNGPGRGQKIG